MSSSNQRPANRGFRSVLRCAISHYRQSPWLSAPEPRRQSSLATSLTVSPSSRPRHVVVDATGLRVYGSGEWHLRKHRHGRRRAWRKLHLGVDETTKEIVAVEVTRSRVHDSSMLPRLLSKIPGRIGQVSGDGAYDTRACYQSILGREAVAAIPPRRNARLSEGVDPPDWRAMRDASLRRIEELGRHEWRASSGCTRQSLAENAVSRFKGMFGSNPVGPTIRQSTGRGHHQV